VENNALLNEIFSSLEEIKTDSQIHQPKNFIQRSRTLDQIEFLLAHFSEQESVVRRDTEALKSSLEEIDRALFGHLRNQLKKSRDKGALLTTFLEEYCASSMPESGEILGYDETDAFLNGLLTSGVLPKETVTREPEMIFYQKTPARIIVELIKEGQFTPKDVFFDIGCGLGQPNILVNLLTSTPSVGIELDPAFSKYAQGQAEALNLNDIRFVNADARQADYSMGTVFFMYTPFMGNILGEVLQRLRLHSRGRKIKLFTYGPCTAEVSKQDWLVNDSGSKLDDDRLATFVSVDQAA
jgi:hypothetical protein